MSTSIVTLATGGVLLGLRDSDPDVAPEISWGQTGMITPEGSPAKGPENPRPRQSPTEEPKKLAWCSAMLNTDRMGFIARKPLEALGHHVQAAKAQ